MNRKLLKAYLKDNKIYCFYDKVVEKNFIDQFNLIKEFGQQYYNNSDKKFSEILYCYINDITISPSCLKCGKENMKFIIMKLIQIN